MRIHDNVLCASEIAQRYNAVTAVPGPSGLLLLGGMAGASLGWGIVRRRAYCPS